MKAICRFCTLTAAWAIFASCAPTTFYRTTQPSWTSIEMSKDMTFEEAWPKCVDVLARKFELEMIEKDAGYIRTAWIYTWWKKGVVTEAYRVQAVVKFSPDKRKVDISTKAHYLRSNGWVTGSDTLLMSTLKTDIMGVVSRTTR